MGLSNSYHHEPVMLPQVLRFLAVRPGDRVADVTAGGGGHLRVLAQQGGRVLALDRDPRALQEDAAGGTAREFPTKVTLRHATFAELPALLQAEKLSKLDALLCDLGVSSPQLDCPERGFALRQDGPLDMRMDPSRGITAYQWLARCSERELADCLFHYGQERRSRRVARAIVHARPLPDSTCALANVIARAVGGKRGRIHPATRSFQALRMVVNDELGQLAQLLEALPHVLAPGGRAVFIAFHSLEDGMIKRALREGARGAISSIRTPAFCHSESVRDDSEAPSVIRHERSPSLSFPPPPSQGQAPAGRPLEQSPVGGKKSTWTPPPGVFQVGAITKAPSLLGVRSPHLWTAHASVPPRSPWLRTEAGVTKGTQHGEILRYAQDDKGGKGPLWELLCRKPQRPELEEVQRNPRCRSARLRAIRMLEGQVPEVL